MKNKVRRGSKCQATLLPLGPPGGLSWGSPGVPSACLTSCPHEGLGAWLVGSGRLASPSWPPLLTPSRYGAS